MPNWFCFRDIKNRGIRTWPYFWGKKTIKQKQAASSVSYCAYPLNIFLYKFTLFSVRYVNNLVMYLMCRLFILYVIYRPLWHKRRGNVVPNSSRKKLVNKLNKFHLYLQTRELRGCLNQSKEV